MLTHIQQQLTASNVSLFSVKFYTKMWKSAYRGILSYYSRNGSLTTISFTPAGLQYEGDFDW